MSCRLGHTHIPTFNRDYDGQLTEIAENLHRLELTALERAQHVARWLELSKVLEEDSATEAKGAQLGHPSGGEQPHDLGVSRAAKELGVSRQEVQRAVKIASIVPDAVTAAKEAGIDINQSKLLKVAEEPADCPASGPLRQI
jgi:hypothetical protein